jgi:hypothetical protein
LWGRDRPVQRQPWPWHRKGATYSWLTVQEFPRDKVCGDAIPGSALSVLYELGMEQRIKDSNFYAAHSLLLCSPSEYVMRRS